MEVGLVSETDNLLGFSYATVTIVYIEWCQEPKNHLVKLQWVEMHDAERGQEE